MYQENHWNTNQTMLFEVSPATDQTLLGGKRTTVRPSTAASDTPIRFSYDLGNHITLRGAGGGRQHFLKSSSMLPETRPEDTVKALAQALRVSAFCEPVQYRLHLLPANDTAQRKGTANMI